MRVLVVALSFFLFFAATQSASAYYYDDSVVIEIGDGVPSEGPSTAPSGGPPSGEGGGTGTAGTDVGGVGGGSEGGAQGSSVNGNTNSVGNSSAGSGSSEGNSQPDSSGVAHDSLFDFLVTQGAITGGGQNSNTEENISNSSANPNAESGSGGVNDNASNDGDTTINAAKLRLALRGNDSFKQILEDYSSAYYAGKYRMLSTHDVGLMGATAILEDTNIDELTFGAIRFEIVYRSRGYLLGFIPKTFPVRIAVDPQTSIAQNRVVLTLPWYRFFIRKLFTTSTLAREIDVVVTADIRLETDTSADVQARLFEAVSFVLKRKAGTIGIN